MHIDIQRQVAYSLLAKLTQGECDQFPQQEAAKKDLQIREHLFAYHRLTLMA